MNYKIPGVWNSKITAISLLWDKNNQGKKWMNTVLSWWNADLEREITFLCAFCHSSKKFLLMCFYTNNFCYQTFKCLRGTVQTGKKKKWKSSLNTRLLDGRDGCDRIRLYETDNIKTWIKRTTKLTGAKTQLQLPQGFCWRQVKVIKAWCAYF